MKNLLGLLAFLVACSVQAEWHSQGRFSYVSGELDQTSLKIKLLEMSTLRKWDIYYQDHNAFMMRLKDCQAQLLFSDDSVTLKLNQKDDGWESSCSSKWTGNLKKDIQQAIKVERLKKEAYDLAVKQK